MVQIPIHIQVVSYVDLKNENKMIVVTQYNKKGLNQPLLVRNMADFLSFEFFTDLNVSINSKF